MKVKDVQASELQRGPTCLLCKNACVCAVTCHGELVTGSAVPEQWALGQLSGGDPAAAPQAEPQLGSSARDC